MIDQIGAIFNSDLSHEEIADRITDMMYKAHLQTWDTGHLREVAWYAQHQIPPRNGRWSRRW